MKNMVFEIGKWPMFKVNMIRTTEDHVHVLYAFDALIMDAFSVIMLARELRDTYDGNVCDEKLEFAFSINKERSVSYSKNPKPKVPSSLPIVGEILPNLYRT